MKFPQHLELHTTKWHTPNNFSVFPFRYLTSTLCPRPTRLLRVALQPSCKNASVVEHSVRNDSLCKSGPHCPSGQEFVPTLLRCWTFCTRAHQGHRMERHSVTHRRQESRRLSDHVCHVQDIWNDFVIEAIRRWGVGRCNRYLFVAVSQRKNLTPLTRSGLTADPHNLNHTVFGLCVQALSGCWGLSRTTIFVFGLPQIEGNRPNFS